MGLKLHETKDERKKDECSKAYEETILKFAIDIDIGNLE